jgi:gamma-glutamyl-gamma-aminobutyrate hydrolase PuuD
MEKLKILLSQRILTYNGFQYDSIDRSWYSYFKNHDLTFLPNYLDQDFNRIAETVDLFVITGGDDSAIRRTVELKLANLMMSLNKPIFGVCHGCFMLTEILGGTIINKFGHTDTEHLINYKNQSIIVNSYHSLGIFQPHSSAKVLATDNENDCEAWIDNNLAAVVWHPERMTEPFLPTEIQELIFRR